MDAKGIARLRECVGACELNATVAAWEDERAVLLEALRQESVMADRYRWLRQRMVVGEVRRLAAFAADDTEGYNRAIDIAVDAAIAEAQP